MLRKVQLLQVLLLAVSLYSSTSVLCAESNEKFSCIDLDIATIDDYLLGLSNVTSETINQHNNSSSSKIFGADKSDWAKLLSLQRALPDGELKQKLRHLFKLLVVAHYQANNAGSGPSQLLDLSKNDDITNNEGLINDVAAYEGGLAEARLLMSNSSSPLGSSSVTFDESKGHEEAVDVDEIGEQMYILAVNTTGTDAPPQIGDVNASAIELVTESTLDDYTDFTGSNLLEVNYSGDGESSDIQMADAKLTVLQETLLEERLNNLTLLLTDLDDDGDNNSTTTTTIVSSNSTTDDDYHLENSTWPNDDRSSNKLINMLSTSLDARQHHFANNPTSQSYDDLLEQQYNATAADDVTSSTSPSNENVGRLWHRRQNNSSNKGKFSRVKSGQLIGGNKFDLVKNQLVAHRLHHKNSGRRTRANKKRESSGTSSDGNNNAETREKLHLNFMRQGQNHNGSKHNNSTSSKRTGDKVNCKIEN